MLIGETIGRYKMVEHLGHGGMAEVYKAYHLQLERDVAIKILHPFLAREADFLTRFQREARAVASLRHPNVVQVFDFDYDKERDLYYMVMEFIDGLSLKIRLQELIDNEERMPLDEAIHIVSSVGDALGYAHRRGMVHRDVKPANVMFNSEGQVILTDFGIAKMVNVAGLTASGSMIGTPAYMAPEQGLGQAGDERADIYSLGAVLYQLVTGQLPFMADTPMGVVLKHINAPLPSPRTLRPDLPVPLERVIMRVMEKEPPQRYQTAQEFVSELRRASASIEGPSGLSEDGSTTSGVKRTPFGQRPFLRGRGSPPIPPVTDAQPTAGSGGRRRWWMWGLAALGVLVVLGGGIWAISSASLDVSGAVTETPTPSLTASTEAPSDVATLTAQAIAGAPTASPSPAPTATPSPTPTRTPSPTPDLTATADALCDFDFEVVEESYSGPVWMAPGQEFTMRWTVRNSGTCAWRPGFQLVLVGENEDTLEWPSSVPVEMTEEGEEQTLVLDLVAPTEEGRYEAVWRFQTEEGVLFGSLLSVTLHVGPTPTPSSTPVLPTPTPVTQPLVMTTPMLVDCAGNPGSGYYWGRVEWGASGGAGRDTFHFFYGTPDSQYKLSGPFNEFDTFPHIMTYFTVSGDGPPWPQVEDCNLSDWGESGTCETESGQWVAWWKVVFETSNCPADE